MNPFAFGTTVNRHNLQPKLIRRKPQRVSHVEVITAEDGTKRMLHSTVIVHSPENFVIK